MPTMLPRKLVRILSVVITGLVLIATGFPSAPQVSAQALLEIAISSPILLNSDCSVGRYSIDIPDGYRFEKPVVIGMRSRETGLCSLVVNVYVSGLSSDSAVSGVSASSDTLTLQKVEVEHDRRRIDLKSQFAGPLPPAEGSLHQWVVIIYLHPDRP